MERFGKRENNQRPQAGLAGNRHARKRPRIAVLMLLALAAGPTVAVDGGVTSTSSASASGSGTLAAPTAVAASDTPSPPTNTQFTLIRVAPFSGVNPFDFQDVRAAIESTRSGGSGPTPPPGGTSCTVGPLLVTTGFPLFPQGDAYVDINPASNTLSIRETGAPAPDTALVISKPDTINTRFVPGTGWQAVSPPLPQNFINGPVDFVLRRQDSGDFYALRIGFIPGSFLHLSSASGNCCGQGGCP